MKEVVKTSHFNNVIIRSQKIRIVQAALILARLALTKTVGAPLPVHPLSRIIVRTYGIRLRKPFPLCLW
jgi:hypothetical protein